MRTWECQSGNLRALDKPHAKRGTSAQSCFEGLFDNGGGRRSFNARGLAIVINENRAVVPLDALELTFVHGIETNRATRPLVI